MTTIHATIFPPQGSAAWEFVWNKLASTWGSFSQPNKAWGGEDWQLMGIEMSEDGMEWKACFRHRVHPKTQRREYSWYLVPDSVVEPLLSYENQSERQRRISVSVTAKHHRAQHVRFDERDCSGVFDGNSVVSDADSGL